MAEKRYKARVVIPVYRTDMSPLAVASLRNTFEKLSSWPVTLVVPHGLDVSPLRRLLPAFDTACVSDEWLGVKNGIAGYNAMMLDRGFYDMFADSEYILVCHTDAWIFRDELELWCDRGWDCVAAPWVGRRVYELPVVAQVSKLNRWIAARRGRPVRADIYGKVGNGGLSLRRVEAFAAACDRYADTAAMFLSQRHHLYNEDVFWATVPDGFRYPSQAEALRFSFDTHPAYCYRLCGGRLPFGCHSWSKRRMFGFWKNIIPYKDYLAHDTL